MIWNIIKFLLLGLAGLIFIGVIITLAFSTIGKVILILLIVAGISAAGYFVIEKLQVKGIIK